jgi:hypothetical protein
MSKQIEALKLSLEALEAYGTKHAHTYGLDGAWDKEIMIGTLAVMSIREALAQSRSDDEQPALDEGQTHYKKVIDDVQALFEAKREQQELASASVEPVAKVVSTAPERIWLDLGFDPEVEDEVSFDDLFDATWSHDNATGNGIEYVRADLAPANANAGKPWVGLTDEDHAEVKDVMLHVGVGAGVAWIEHRLREKNA